MLQRVKNGESLEVTEHGRPIARLVPILADAPIIDRLISEGRIVAAVNPEALLAPVPPVQEGAPSLSDALRRARETERI